MASASVSDRSGAGSPVSISDHEHDNGEKNLNKKLNKGHKVTGTIQDIFNDDSSNSVGSTTFDLFMKHLSKEISIENGLFIIYLLQFQQFLVEYNILGDNKEDLVMKGNIKLPSHVPQSPLFVMTNVISEHKNIDIVNRNSIDDGNGRIVRKIDQLIEINVDSTLKMLNAFVFIYEKFIKRDIAPFEVNISSRNRDQIAYWYNLLNFIKNEINGSNNNVYKFARSRSKSGMAQIDFFTSSELKQFRSENINNFNQINFDFIKLWRSLLCASKEILGLMNQSVSRYFREQLNNTYK